MDSREAKRRTREDREDGPGMASGETGAAYAGRFEPSPPPPQSRTLPMWEPARLDGDEMNQVFIKHEVLYVCKGPACHHQSTYWGEARAHQRETGHTGLSLRRVKHE